MQKNQQVHQQSEQLLTRRDLARRWSCCIETIKRRERQGVLTANKQNCRFIRYRLSEVISIEAAAGGNAK